MRERALNVLAPGSIGLNKAVTEAAYPNDELIGEESPSNEERSLADRVHYKEERLSIPLATVEATLSPPA
jgi:hypothetical protein